MVSAQSIIVASSSQVSSELADEVVILDLESGVYHGLNAVGARIWSLIQQPMRVAEVSDQIVREYDVELARCEADVLALLGELEAEGLVECDVEQACCTEATAGVYK